MLIFLLLLSSVQNRLVAACDSLTYINVSFITTAAADLSWTQRFGILGYQVARGISPIPSKNQSYFTVNPNYTVSGLNCGSKYYVFVRVICAANDTSAWQADSFMTVACCDPPKPVTYGPITSNTISFDITAVSKAYSYEYYYSDKLTPPTQKGTATTNTSILLQGLTPITDYIVCARSLCNWVDSISVWACDVVKTKPPCEPVTGLVKSHLREDEFALSWSPISNANGYEYSIDTNPQAQASGNTTTNTQVTVDGLTPNTVYTFCVRAECGTAGYKTPWTCDTLSNPPLDIETAYLSTKNISVYPNPAKSYITIKGLSTSLSGTVQLRDIFGKTIQQQEVTDQQYTIDVANVPSGLYFILYWDESHSSMLKVIIE